MSRIGKRPVTIPNGVSAEIADGTLTVKGPKGTLTLSLFLAVFGAVLLAVLLGNQLVRPLLVLAAFEAVRGTAASAANEQFGASFGRFENSPVATSKSLQPPLDYHSKGHRSRP